MTGFILVRNAGSRAPLYWCVPYERGGRWAPNRAQAKIYSTRRAATIAWVWLARENDSTELEIEKLEEALA